TLAPPGRSTSAPGSRTSNVPGARGTMPPRQGSKAPPRGAAPPAPEAPARARVNPRVVVPILTVFVALVVGGVYYGLHAGDDIGVARLSGQPRVGASAPAASCQGES